MAGVSDNFDGSQIVLGPGRLYVDVAVPAVGSRMTLDSGGAPDTTANPNAKHLGLTAGGSVVSFKQELQEFESDESTAPHLTKIIKEPTMIKAELLQVADLTNVLKYCWPGGTYATASGYKEITFGGKDTITYYSFVLICPTVADATKFHVFQLYKAFNAGGIEFNITRKDQSKVPLELRANAITTRTAGNQLGNAWVSIA